MAHRLGGIEPTRWTLADGRDLLFFALPGHTPAPVPDRRSLPAREQHQSQLRFDRQTGQWVIIAALRQDRTYKPAADDCPLCPEPSGLTSEVPAPDYDVVVFENRFPSFAGAGHLPPGLTATTSLPRRHTAAARLSASPATTSASFADLEPAQARLVVDAWRHRTADLMARPGIEQVFCFENRGEEIGVTLTHPHGQIYGYPFLTPRTAEMLRQAQAHRDRVTAPTCSPTSSRARLTDGSRDHRPHRPVHRVRPVRRPLAGGSPHLSKSIRAQPH